MKKLDGNRLVQLRKLRGISQKNLAKAANLSQRQLFSIENSEGRRQNKTIENLAKALRVDQGVLTGDLPIPQDLTDVGRKGFTTNSEEQATISVKVSYDIRNWYDLVRHFYGVSMSDLVRISPLLLVLLAEGSKKWQEQQNKSTKDLLKQIKEKTKELPISAEVNTQCSYIEEKLPSFGEMTGRELPTDHTFLRYLRALAKESARAQSIQFHQNNFVSYDLFQNDLEWAFLPSKLKNRIKQGEIRFHQALVERGWKLVNLFVNLMDEIIEKTDTDINPFIQTIMSMEWTKENLKEVHEEFFSPEYFLELIWELLSQKGDQETFQFREIWDVVPGDSNKEKLKRFLYPLVSTEENLSKHAMEQMAPKVLKLFITPEIFYELQLLCSKLKTEEKIQDIADVYPSLLEEKEVITEFIPDDLEVITEFILNYLNSADILKDLITVLLTKIEQMKYEDISAKIEQLVSGETITQRFKDSFGLINDLRDLED